MRRSTAPAPSARGPLRLVVALTAALAVLAGPLPTATAAEVPHVFVFSGTWGFRHSSIARAKAVVADLATSTGAFTVEFSEDAAAFTPALYERADVVYVLSATGEYPLNAAQKTDLLRFFACGGGYVGTHASSDANYSWPDMLELVGAWFNTHPNGWGRPPVTLHVGDQEHPATRPWHGQTSIQHADEYYKWRLDIRGAQDIQPLLTLDESTATNGSQYHPSQPVVYAKTFRGLGRVVNSNIGHGDTVFDLPEWKQHFLGAVEWVAEPGVDRACLAADAGAVLEVASAKVATISGASGGSGNGGTPVEYAIADTAAAVSKRLFGRAQKVVVVGAGDTASALAAAPLAAAIGAPLLVTASGALSPETRAEITRLGAREAILVGGTGAIAAGVETEIRNGPDGRPGLPVPVEPRTVACGAEVPSCTAVPTLNDDLTTRRIAGADAAETAALVARELPADAPVVLVDTAELDGGRHALAGAGLAAALRGPVLLTGADALPRATADALAGRTVTIVGSPAAAAGVEPAIAAAAATVTRLAADDRSALSAATADAALSGGATAESLWLASGADLPMHALLAGAAAGTQGGVALLAGADDLAADAPAGAWLRTHAGAVRRAGGVGPTTELGHDALACAQQILLTPAGVRVGCGDA